MKLRQHFRDLQEWNSQGLPIKSTASDCAVKLFDSALTQYVGWYDDDIGLATTVEKMLDADSNFLLGRTLAIGLDLIATDKTIRSDPKLRMELQCLKKMEENQRSLIEWRESKHVEAIDFFAQGSMGKAAQIWEKILAKFPMDMMALKFAHDVYFYLGDKQNLLDSIERVYPRWENSKDPLQGYIHGMYAFGLEERRQYSQAERQAKIGLQKIPKDAWAVHALAHVHTMQHRIDEGVQAIGQTKPDWHDCNYLACHNYWHWSLFQIELEQIEDSIAIYEKEIGPRANKNQSMLDIVDAASLLYRLDLLFPSKFYGSKKHWQDLYKTCEPHFPDQALGFNTAHFAMTCLGCDRPDKAEELLEDLRSIGSEGLIKDDWVAVTEQVLLSMIDFKRENYQNTVDRLLSIKEDIVKMGGSDAQRDVFNQLLIVAASKAKLTTLCKELVQERQTIMGQDIVVREISRALDQC